jgi:hypothetical protein
MTQQQKTIVIRFVLVLFLTLLAVFALLHIRDLINRSEAMKAMKIIGQQIMAYKEANGLYPPESFVNDLTADLRGYGRADVTEYRGRWLTSDSGPDEILAYVYKTFGLKLTGDGYVVLRHNGRVEWMEADAFKSLLAHQQTQAELEALQQDSQLPAIKPIN